MGAGKLSRPTRSSEPAGADVGPPERFWTLAEEFLAQLGVTRSTMMGLPCLRVDAKFFASLDPKTGCLVVKLPQTEVQEALASSEGLPFAPAGRVFREWVAIPAEHHARWRGYLGRAKAFVGNAR